MIFKKGHTIFLLENWDGIPTKEEGRHKVDRLTKLVRQLEVDGLGGTEVRVNGARSSIEEKLEILLKSETEDRVAHGYNSNENVGLSQEGGTCEVIFDNLSERKIKKNMTPQA